MAIPIRQSFEKDVETRYDEQHVGSAFDAKNIPKLKPIDVSLKASLKETLVSKFIDGVSFERYGIPKFHSVRPEPKGKGRVGVPVPKPFTPTPPPVIPDPIPGPSLPIFWNTDPDIWDLTSLFIGPEYWNGPEGGGAPL